MENMNATPMANRFTIGLFGRRNAGKSSLINALTGQDIAVTSEVAGTTTDPVYKAMELLPIGPVVFIDTAGLDDTGELGKLRIEKTYEVLRKCNLALVVLDVESGITTFETEFIEQLLRRKIPCISVLNQCDKRMPGIDELETIRQTVKIPRWIRQIAGGDIKFEWVSGACYPRDISEYAVIVHCGGCMLNRREMQYRVEKAREQGVYITNYGMLIAYVMGILPRALKPFPAASLALEKNGLV